MVHVSDLLLPAGALLTHELEIRRSRFLALVARAGSHEEAREGLPDARVENLWIVVGPEGGIADRELEAFREAGGRPVLLSSNVLRSASAGPVAMAALSGMRLVAG